jgi:digeranylgeranylglycerophospholipid reductase
VKSRSDGGGRRVNDLIAAVLPVAHVASERWSALTDVAVIGGGVGGLAAAERFRSFADVTLFERQRYGEKRVNCGEAINDAGLVPLAKTPENGFHNRIEAFDIEIYRDNERAESTSPLGESTVAVENGYVTDRDVVERRWAERLRENGVEVREDTNVGVADYRDIVSAYDYVVDATGQPSLSTKARDETGKYTGDIVALDADVEGDFTPVRRPRIVFEGYVGYFWVFPKSATRANVGIGWAGEERPADYMAELHAACDRAGVPRPDRSATNVYTIPRGPSLDPAETHPEPGVFLVGDAAGVANRYQGEGICQAIRSSYLLADLVEHGESGTYPERLAASMRREYLLATLMRGVWEGTESAELLATVAEAIDGLDVDAVTRRPARVAMCVLRRPRLAATLAANPTLRRRCLDALCGRWEYNVPGSHSSA